MGHRFFPQRSLAMTLLATAAAASLLGGCGHDGGVGNRLGGGPFASSGLGGNGFGGNGFGKGGLGSGGLRNSGLGLFNRKQPDVQMSADEAADATSKWARAYTKNPQDPNTALGYARTLRALGNKQRALSVLQSAYISNPNHGPLAAELGKTALEAGQVRLASNALRTAENKGVKDWKTLSAQGTLAAKNKDHAKAQRYYQAALRKKPDSVSVINNLALSYALDGKAAKAESLLRQAANKGYDDKRLRQNLALVLGVQGKYDEARQVAAVDMGATKANKSVSYLKNMLNKPQAVASANSAAPRHQPNDWEPFANTVPGNTGRPVKTARARPKARKTGMPIPRVQMVKPVDDTVSSSSKVAAATPWKTTITTNPQR